MDDYQPSVPGSFFINAPDNGTTLYIPISTYRKFTPTTTVNLQEETLDTQHHYGTMQSSHSCYDDPWFSASSPVRESDDGSDTSFTTAENNFDSADLLNPMDNEESTADEEYQDSDSDIVEDRSIVYSIKRRRRKARAPPVLPLKNRAHPEFRLSANTEFASIESHHLLGVSSARFSAYLKMKNNSLTSSQKLHGQNLLKRIKNREFARESRRRKEETIQDMQKRLDTMSTSLFRSTQRLQWLQSEYESLRTKYYDLILATSSSSSRTDSQVKTRE